MFQEYFSLIGLSFSLVLGIVMISKKSFFYLGFVFIACALILFEEIFWQSGSIKHYPYLAEVFKPISFIIPALLFFHSSRFFRKNVKRKWMYTIFPIAAYVNFTPLYLSNLEYKNCYVEKEVLDTVSNACAKFLTHKPVLFSEDVFDFILLGLFLLLALFIIKTLFINEIKHKPKKKQGMFIRWNNIYFWLVLSAIVSLIAGTWFLPDAYCIRSIFISLIAIVTSLVMLSKSAYFSEETRSANYSAVSKGDVRRMVKDIRLFLSQENIYSSTSLTLDDVAKRMGISSNKLSFAIGAQNLTFRGILNEIRINKAADFLKTDDWEQYSIEGLSQKFGYKSKSTFYKNFKVIKGSTPREFISNETKSSHST